MGTTGIFFGFVAGLLSTLSPCVLPLLPLVLASAVSAHRFGMLALSAGLVVSFVSVGLFLATIGFSIGIDSQTLRIGSAVLLGLVGILLLSTVLQQRFAILAGGLGNAGNRLMASVVPAGLGGQFLIGLILGTVWSPCVGPTLGAASVLASQGKDLGQVIAVMMAFGIGTAVPLVVVGSLSRDAMLRWRGRMLGAGQTGKMILGGGVLALSALILTGLDHRLEAFLVGASPAWLTELTTRF